MTLRNRRHSNGISIGHNLADWLEHQPAPEVRSSVARPGSGHAEPRDMVGIDVAFVSAEMVGDPRQSAYYEGPGPRRRDPLAVRHARGRRREGRAVPRSRDGRLGRRPLFPDRRGPPARPAAQLFNDRAELDGSPYLPNFRFSGLWSFEAQAVLAADRGPEHVSGERDREVANSPLDSVLVRDRVRTRATFEDDLVPGSTPNPPPRDTRGWEQSHSERGRSESLDSGTKPMLERERSLLWGVGTKSFRPELIVVST